MNAADPTPAPASDGSVLVRLLAMATAGALLYLLAGQFRALHCWVLFCAVAVTAWPLWLYQRDVALFARRLWLAGVTREDSAIRRWFWSGHLSQALHAAVSLVWATLLLALAAVLQPVHWTVLAADVLFLSLLVGPVRRGLAAQVNPDQIGTVARRWPLFAFNLAFLTGTFLLADFFVAGAPDTRGMPWHRVAEQAFATAGADATCPPAGWITGALAAVEQMGWHAAQLVIPGLSEPLLRLAAWGVVLVHAGLFAYLFTRLQLGVVTWLESRPRGTGHREGPFSLAFIFTILVLALPSLYLSLTPSAFDTTVLERTAGGIVGWVNPCRGEDTADEALQRSLDQDLERARLAALAAAERDVDAALDALFADVEPAIDRYLDWYFTVVGEYQRLAASFAGDFGALMGETLQQYLFDETGFADRLDAASAAIEDRSIRRMTAAAEDLRQRASAAIEVEPCRIETTNPEAIADLGRDRVRATIAAGSGVAAGAVTAKLLAKKAGATLAGKVAAKKGFQAAAGLAGKVVAKKGGSIVVSAAAAAAICSPGGPLAVVCGVVAGAVTWLAADKAMVELDEALFRDEMRREILASLAESRALLAADLKAQHAAVVDHAARVIDNGLQRVFIPARDGL